MFIRVFRHLLEQNRVDDSAGRKINQLVEHSADLMVLLTSSQRNHAWSTRGCTDIL